MKTIGKALKSREGVIAMLILAIAALVSISNPTFLQLGNIKDILMNVSYITIGALGMTMIIITGGIDVSSGAQLALLSLLCGKFSMMGIPVIVYCILVIIAGSLIGLLNGTIVVKLHVPPMICTLALYNVCRGAILVVTGGKWITGLPKSFNVIGKESVFGIPISVLIMIAMVALITWFMAKTTLGRSIYACGSNRQAARLAGINTDRTIILTWMISSALLGVASIVYCTRFTTIQTNIGENLHLTLIAASVIGGVSILGGSGKPIGTFFGALLLTLIRTALLYWKVSTYWDQAVQGALILLSIEVGMFNAKHALKSAEGKLRKESLA